MLIRYIYYGVFFSVLSIFIIINSCHGQTKGFQYIAIEDRSEVKLTSLSVYDSAIKNGRNIEFFLPKGYSRSGNINYTDYIQNAINKFDTIVMPNFPILIDWRGINLRSNMVIVFRENSKLIIKPNDKTNYHAIGMVNINNVKIFSPKIQGDRASHANVKGEWGHGIKIFGSNSIHIYNAKITDCWGDGIYVGRGKLPFSSNIVISGGTIDNSRRNGISIISCKNLLISNVLISNTNGVLPMAAIDFEPNLPDEELKNINVLKVQTFNNGYSGILIALQKLKRKEISINISEHTDEMTLYYPINIYGSLTGDIKKWGVYGNVNYSNSIWNNKNYIKLINEGGNFNNLIKFNFSNNYIKNNGRKERLDKRKLGSSKINLFLK
ncbi:right-handed parallel beta-helix repeat-containing protein [Sphingobacterium kyonggiense]